MDVSCDSVASNVGQLPACLPQRPDRRETIGSDLSPDGDCILRK